MSEEAPSISSTERSVYVASSNPRPVLEPPTKSTNMDSASASKSSPNTTLLKIVKDDGKDADKAVDTSPQTSSDDKSSSSSDSESSPNIAVQVVRSEEELMNIIERTLLKVIDRRDESKAIRPPSPEEDDSVRPAVKARFFPEITRDAILHIEGTNPFKTMKMFDLAGVEKKAVTLQAIPATYRPYEGCMFDVLSEPDDDTRFQKLKEFFLTLGAPGDKGRECGLFYTFMHFLKLVYLLQVSELRGKVSHVVTTIDYFLDAGIIGCFMRILTYCLDKKFLLLEYNRYLPCRILECLFVCTHVEQPKNETAVEKIIEDEQRAVNIFYPILTGGISAIEQLTCCQLVGNLSSYVNAVNWLLRHPKLCAVVARHLWCSYDVLYTGLRQHEDLRNMYHMHLVYSNIDVTEEDGESSADSIRISDLSMYLALCLACNICAAYPDDNPMSDITPSIVAIVKEGLYEHVGEVLCGIVLNFERNSEMTPSKFLSFVSWCCFQPSCQKIVLEQLARLPSSRHDNPFYFNRNSYTKTRSVVAFLITHAIWFDYEKGSHFAVLGILRLLMDDDTVAMEVVRLAGDLLFDLAHSIHHVRMPEDRDPIAIKRTIFEALLGLAGCSYYKENATKVEPPKCKFSDPLPQCITDIKEYCDRYVKEMGLEKIEKQRLVRCADSFKSEGNNFFLNSQFEAAIECYTKALDTCPLTCTERRVTYHSNRAECYLKTNQPRKAISDCNRAIAQNPSTFKARWRRSQALQLINVKHLAGLDLLTICRREDDMAKNILGAQRLKELDRETFTLMDESNFIEISEQLYGPTVYRGHIARTYGKNMKQAKQPFDIPPFSGKAFHNIFGIGQGDYAQGH